jgi:23S rRNA (pseudouridine1915-N3)-methyltransferase
LRYRVLIVGRSRCGWANEAVAHYSKRMRRYGGVSEESVKEERFRGDVDAVRAAEAKRTLRSARNGLLVVLDERGETLTTEAFATLIDPGRVSGSRVFAIGGAYGHSKEVRDQAWKVVRLSSMVLNHEVARVVLFEQLYRSASLLAGSPYHHGG